MELEEEAVEEEEKERVRDKGDSRKAADSCRFRSTVSIGSASCIN